MLRSSSRSVALYSVSACESIQEGLCWIQFSKLTSYVSLSVDDQAIRPLDRECDRGGPEHVQDLHGDAVHVSVSTIHIPKVLSVFVCGK